MRGRFSVIGVMLIVILAAVRLAPAPDAAAQDGDPCEALAEQAITAALQACAGTAPGDACYGFADAAATSGESALFSAAGEKAALADLDVFSTSGADADAGKWGIVVAMLPAGSPDSVGSVTAVLFGDAQMVRPVQAVPDRPTLNVINSGSAPVNLRNGAAITYDLVGQLAPQEQALADGRNEQADWLRIQFAGGLAWVFTPLISWDGDQSAINALEVLLPNDVTPLIPAGAPFQSFTLSTGSTPATCAAAPSGLLLDYAGAEPAQLQINQINLEIANGTWLVTASANDAVEIKVLAGEGTVTARGVPQTAEAGDTIRVSVGGDDGLTPTTAPEFAPSFAFAEVAYLPLDLLPMELACQVGLVAGSPRVAMRVGPGTERGQLGDMTPEATYTVIGWANDPEGAPWWELDLGGQLTWVPQAEVHTLGMCSEVAQVEAPPLVTAPLSPADGGAATGPDLAPTANSVWQMVPGSDNLVGECSGAPAINFCDHLAAISPADGGIMWRGMEASPYHLSRIQSNVYSYSGPNVLGTGQVTMTLNFSSETTINMTMSLVLSSEPNCQHVYYYTGTRNW